ASCCLVLGALAGQRICSPRGVPTRGPLPKHLLYPKSEPSPFALALTLVQQGCRLVNGRRILCSLEECAVCICFDWQQDKEASERIMRDTITIKGARLHNLKNISLTIPKNKLVVFTGLSGSGKSTLAFDTLHQEAMRQYFESV